MAQKPDPGIAELQIAVSLVPDVNDELELIGLLDFRRRYQEAVAECGKALETAPRNAALRNKLAWMLATCPEASVRDGAEALEIARLLVEGSGRREPQNLDTLAAAYAEAGRFGKAVAAAEEASALARSARQRALRWRFRRPGRDRAGPVPADVCVAGAAGGPSPSALEALSVDRQAVFAVAQPAVGFEAYCVAY